MGELVSSIRRSIICIAGNGGWERLGEMATEALKTVVSIVTTAGLSVILGKQLATKAH